VEGLESRGKKIPHFFSASTGPQRIEQKSNSSSNGLHGGAVLRKGSTVLRVVWGTLRSAPPQTSHEKKVPSVWGTLRVEGEKRGFSPKRCWNELPGSLIKLSATLHTTGGEKERRLYFDGSIKQTKRTQGGDPQKPNLKHQHKIYVRVEKAGASACRKRRSVQSNDRITSAHKHAEKGGQGPGALLASRRTPAARYSESQLVTDDRSPAKIQE